MIRRLLLALALRVLVLLPNPRKGDLVPCPVCRAGNEPDRSHCRNCKAAL